MKKVIIGLMLLFVACSLRAGAFSWAIDLSVVAPANTIGYLVNVSSNVTVDGINNHIATNGLDIVGLKSSAWSTATANELNNDAINYNNVAAVPGQTYYFAFFLVDEANSLVTVGTTIESLVPAITAADNMGPATTFENPVEFLFDENTANWKSTTVPEPTALALLALGVAGLALRRKQVA